MAQFSATVGRSPPSACDTFGASSSQARIPRPAGPSDVEPDNGRKVSGYRGYVTTVPDLKVLSDPELHATPRLSRDAVYIVSKAPRPQP